MRRLPRLGPRDDRRRPLPFRARGSAADPHRGLQGFRPGGDLDHAGAELEFFTDAIEWVANPDHDLDRNSLGKLDCVATKTGNAAPFSWAAIARRIDDDAPMPYMLFFAASGHAAYQIHLPLSVRDEDLDGRSVIVPKAIDGNLRDAFAVIPMAVDGLHERRAAQ